jgi:signal transduction histidine kinase
MASMVVIIAGLAYWDAVRESEAALRDFADAQVTVARALAAGIEAGGTAPDGGVAAALGRVQQAGALRVYVRRPGEAVLRAPGGAPVSSPPLIAALDRGARAVRLSRDEARALGLPPRTAMAGAARVGLAGGGVDVVVVASAERERDREIWARRRLVLSVLAAAGLVLAFGGAAMRAQRKRLLLERELAIAALQRSRDERLERAGKAAALGTLAMGVAHEISTPLGVIAARAEQIQARIQATMPAAPPGGERTTGAVDAGVATILAQIDRIKQIIRGLLGLARGDAPSAERIDPARVVADAVALVEHRFQEAGVRLSPAAGAALPAVLGDARLLEHAVVNLLLNACDACKRDGGAVAVTAARDAGDVTIVVEDSGPGISEADIERALEPFFTTKSREEGSGLGLAIAREIVASHRGVLSLSPIPHPGHGTRATIRLPPVAGDAPRA